MSVVMVAVTELAPQHVLVHAKILVKAHAEVHAMVHVKERVHGVVGQLVQRAVDR